MKSVKQVIDGKIAKMWADPIEKSAMEQIENVARFPDVYSHIAIMPDCHAGMGVPIGSVFATQNVVIPNAVGVDIGCGMSAVRTDLTEDDVRRRSNEIYEITKDLQILSVRKSRPSEIAESLGQFPSTIGYGTDVVERVMDNSILQIGTLGGGNHFIEFQKDEEGFIWIMVHSGSRNLGQVICKYYNNAAIELNARYFSSVDPKHKLAFLSLDTKMGRDYITDMDYAVKYAKLNRREIIMNILCHMDVGYNDYINCCHNFARQEHHFGRNLMVHRKGATHAGNGVLGLIPGSQGTSSYIVEGLGNRESFNSCSHGAGRSYSRKVAKEILSFASEKEKMDKANVIHMMNGKDDLDEAPGAYKDISRVMEAQSDLVSIVYELKPVLSIKN